MHLSCCRRQCAPAAPAVHVMLPGIRQAPGQMRCKCVARGLLGCVQRRANRALHHAIIGYGRSGARPPAQQRVAVGVGV